MQGKQGNHGVKGQPVSVMLCFFSFSFCGQSCLFFRDSKKSFWFFHQGDPGERGLTGVFGNFGPKVRPLTVLKT